MTASIFLSYEFIYIASPYASSSSSSNCPTSYSAETSNLDPSAALLRYLTNFITPGSLRTSSKQLKFGCSDNNGPSSSSSSVSKSPSES